MSELVRAKDRAFVEETLAEVARARAKHPGRKHLLGALTEEVGEVSKALLEGEPVSALKAECIQVACVALRLAVELDADYFPDEVEQAGETTLRLHCGGCDDRLEFSVPGTGIGDDLAVLDALAQGRGWRVGGEGVMEMCPGCLGGRAGSIRRMLDRRDTAMAELGAAVRRGQCMVGAANDIANALTGGAPFHPLP